MERKKAAFLLLILLSCLAVMSAATNPWGGLKKLRFFAEAGDEREFGRVLAQSDTAALSRQEKRDWSRELLALGDTLYRQGKSRLARAVYEKALEVTPDAWYVYNRLYHVRRTEGAALFNVNQAWKQTRLLFRLFIPSLFMLIGVFYVSLGAAILVFLVFALFIMWKYLPLVANDFLRQRKTGSFVLKLSLALFIFAWPLLAGGWGVYPFIIAGFFWIYMEDGEKKISAWLVVFCLVLSIFHGVGKVLERNVADGRFVRSEQLYNGLLRGHDADPKSLDDEEKVLLAYSLYEAGEYPKALDVMGAVSPAYRSALKFDLLGSLYFETGEIGKSIDNFQDSLKINRKNRAALRNITLALLSSDQPDRIGNFSKLFPGMAKIKAEMEKDPAKQVLEKIDPPRSYLWQKAFAFPGENLNIGRFLWSLLKEMAWFPLVVYGLVFLLLVQFNRRLFPFLGESEFCSKCSKILKRKMIEHVHVLCDDCYQLFMVKDVIFFDAKIIKEREITRKQKMKAIVFHFLSVIFPGFALNYYEKSKAFVFFCWSVFFLLGYAIYLSVVFGRYYGVIPLALYAVELVALLVYLAANLYSLKGLDNGF